MEDFMKICVICKNHIEEKDLEYVTYFFCEKHSQYEADMYLEIHYSKSFLDSVTGSINPDYYKQGGLQPYEYLKMKLTSEQYEGWLLGDAMVYLSRYNHKHKGEEQLKDLKKAKWFLEKLIEAREKQREEKP